MLKARSKRTISIFLLSAAFCLLLSSCENPFMQQILEYKTVSFNTNGGSSVPAQNLIKGRKITRPDDPEKPDYFFDGWYSDNETFLYEWDFDDIPTADITLYAKWIDEILISFDLQAEVDKYESAADNMIIKVPGSFILTENIIVPANANDYTLTITSDRSSPYNIYRGQTDTNIEDNSGLFIVTNGAKLIFENIVINGNKSTHTDNAAPLVRVETEGEFTLGDGAVLRNNKASVGGGVFVDWGGIFNMEGGIISGNEAATNGGGVFVAADNQGGGSVFNMEGGTISGNEATTNGGGVFVAFFARFTMSNSEVSDNKALDGGGVYAIGNFNMKDNAKVSDNIATGNGGGVYIINNTFSMEDGTISGNTATTNGGGVYVGKYGKFEISNGTVYGNNATGGLANTATSKWAALFVVEGEEEEKGIAQCIGGTTVYSLDTRDETIEVIDGVLQP